LKGCGETFFFSHEKKLSPYPTQKSELKEIYKNTHLNDENNDPKFAFLF